MKRRLDLPKKSLPSSEEIALYLQSMPGKTSRRELTRAFKISPEQRYEFRQILKDLEQTKIIERGHKKNYALQGHLPEIGLIKITETNDEGELFGVLEQRPHEDHSLPNNDGQIIIKISEKFQNKYSKLSIGDRVLAKLHQRPTYYEAQIVRKINQTPQSLYGLYEIRNDQAILRSVDKRDKDPFIVIQSLTSDLIHGDLVEAEIVKKKTRYGPPQVRICKKIGSLSDPRTTSLLAIATHNIPHQFSQEALDYAESCQEAPLGDRIDLRSIPFVTIDGSDARDFDDAVFAEKEYSEGQMVGWHIIVAIADVAWYVKPGDVLDQESYLRGNSVYFPDRVIPMLPEALSNGWCSLKAGEDRPCLAVHLWIDCQGHKRRHLFVRGLMRSVARLTYEQAQETYEQQVGPHCDLLNSLYGAWEALQIERKTRGVLELDIVERKVILGSEGRINQIVPRKSLDSHRVIEDFMIAANVAAAEQIEHLKRPCMYRVHDSPSVEKLNSLRQFLDSLEIPMAKDQSIHPSMFNRILSQVKGKTNESMVNEIILRSQAQAIYSPKNLGHFGLGLKRYAHFTSPIRRYADLLVHRALISGLNLGEGALGDYTNDDFDAWGQHISITERRAASAERDVVDRFTAQFLSDKVGTYFSGRISGVTRFGLFITLSETGADGLVPLSTLPRDYYHLDDIHHRLTGRQNRLIFSIGDSVDVELIEANPVTGGLMMRLISPLAEVVHGPISPKAYKKEKKSSPYKKKSKYKR